MKSRHAIVILFSLLLISPLVARAQYTVLHGAFGAGGGVRSNGEYFVYDTAGQPVVGIVSGASNEAKAGFWYCAGIASTVDVAFSSLFGELGEDAVLLSWSTSASAPIEGFNVYRSEDTEETFVRINGALIPRAIGNSYTDETIVGGKTYSYRIGAVEREKEWYSRNVSLAVPSKPTTMYQNYPNPFNPSTTIAFYLADPGHVSLAVYDVRGGVVRTLFDGSMSAGRHAALWDGKNEGGREAASGVYYYRLASGKTTLTKKLVVVR